MGHQPWMENVRSAIWNSIPLLNGDSISNKFTVLLTLKKIDEVRSFVINKNFE